MTDFTDRAVCIIFGDGAGAVLLEPTHDSEDCGIIDMEAQVEGVGGQFLNMPGGGSLNPARQFGPAVISKHTAELWVFLLAPLVGAELAARLLHAFQQRRRVLTHRLCGTQPDGRPLEDRDREAAVLADIMMTRTADEWEHFLQARHVPAARVRRLAEAVHDPQFASRNVTHHHAAAPGVDGEFDVPLAAFKLAHGGPSIERPPPEFGADTDAVLVEHGYDADQIAGFRRAGVI